MMADPFATDQFTQAFVIDPVAGVVGYDPPRRKVAIIGTGPSRTSAPWTDPEWVIYGLNEIPQRRATVWWEMHPMSVQSDAELQWLERCPHPVYVLDLDDARCRSGAVPDERVIADTPGRVRPFSGVKTPVQYPLERVLELTGGCRYFTSTFSYELALAIAEGASAIALYGVELYNGSARERLVERCCTAYWLGVAEGRGVEIVNDCRLAWQPHLYGYHYDKEKTWVESELAQLRRVMEWEAKERAEKERRQGE